MKKRIPYFDVWGRGGSPLLMVHGFMMHGEMFYPVIDLLARTHLVIIPDLRGYGNSRELPGPYTVAQHSRDLDYILSALGFDAVHLLGYSMGGTVAQHFAWHHPAKVRSLILSNTFAYKALTGLERLQQQLVPQVVGRVGADGLGKLLHPRLVELVGKLDPATYRWYLSMMRQNRTDVLLRSLHDLFKFDSRAWLPKLQVPALVLGGSHDLIVPPAHAHQLAQLLPQARIKIFDQAGHSAIHTHTEAYIGLVRSFLQAVDEQGQPDRQAS